MTAEDRAPAQTVIREKSRSRAANLTLIRQIWPWVFLVLIIAIFTVAAKTLNNTNFLSLRSIQGISVYATQILLVALGETLIIISAGIDLSVGYIVGLAAVIAAVIMQALYAAGAPPVVTILLGMAGGVAACAIPGWLNGLLVSRIRVPPFISTLGMGYAVFGAALLITGGYPVAQQPPYLGALGNGSAIFYWPGHGISFFRPPPGATQADMASIFPILPNVVLVTILVTALIWFILSKTQFGQHLYAIGGNMQAAVRAGIPVNKTLTWVYVIAGLLSGVAGSLWAARFTSGDAKAGETTLLTAIAAVVIGGASLFGGEGSVIGTVIGALIIATIQFGLVILGMPPFFQYIAVGVVVIIAVIVDQFGRTLE